MIRVIKKLSVGAALMLAACGQQSNEHHFDAKGFGGVESQSFGLLAAACSYSGTTGDSDMTITVASGETAYVYYRTTDSKVVANAAIGGVDCVNTATRRVIITGGAGAQKVLIDFVNAPATLFAIGTMTNAGIAIDLDNGVVAAGDVVTIRGTSGVDTWTFGQVTGGTTIGAAVNVDAFKDITFVGVDSLVVTTGDGNDVVSGLGNAAVGGVATANLFPIAMTVWGGAGNDTISSGAAGVVNTLHGEAGNDTFTQQLALADDVINGGDDTDHVTYAVRTTGVDVTLEGTNNDGEGAEADNVAADVENVTGGAGNDTLDATTSNIAHVLAGNAGNDTLIGATVIDTLNGGVGDDILRGAAGADILVGGAGIDTADYTGAAAGVTVSLVPGTGTNEDTINPLAAVDVENLRGSALNDALTGNDNANIIWGAAGVDTILGGLGDDALYGELGADAISGEAGDDVVVGGDGVDTTLSGGDGNDIVDAVDSGAGADDAAAVTCGNDNDYALLDGTDAALGGGANCELRN